MQMINQLFEDGRLNAILTDNLHNNWKGTLFESYVNLSTKNKGVFGEALVEQFMKNLGCSASSPTNVGHDRIFDGYKTEIKFSLANSPMDKKLGKKLINPDEFTFNHIAQYKDWDRLRFFGINPESSQDRVNWKPGARPPQFRALFMTKVDFQKHLPSSVFSRQQGGNSGGNDDYMVGGYNKFRSLIELPFVRPVIGNW